VKAPGQVVNFRARRACKQIDLFPETIPVLRFRLRPTCDDCRVDTVDIGEFYMVKDSVWEQATGLCASDNFYPWDQAFYCIGCLEQRLGRRLTSADFTDAPLNDPAQCPERRYSDRLLKRLGRAGHKRVIKLYQPRRGPVRARE
jgi:hypothetical protein